MLLKTDFLQSENWLITFWKEIVWLYFLAWGSFSFLPHPSLELHLFEKELSLAQISHFSSQGHTDLSGIRRARKGKKNLSPPGFCIEKLMMKIGWQKNLGQVDLFSVVSENSLKAFSYQMGHKIYWYEGRLKSVRHWNHILDFYSFFSACECRWVPGRASEQRDLSGRRRRPRHEGDRLGYQHDRQWGESRHLLQLHTITI